MNILISPHRDGDFYFRSDTTMIRALPDFYMPDHVEKLSATAALFVRCERSGKAVQENFAHRYFGDFNCGILFKATLKAGSVPEADRPFVENAMDYTTVIPYTLVPNAKLPEAISLSSPLTLKFNGRTLASVTTPVSIASLYRRFVAMSRHSSVRIGDFLAFELTDGIELPPQGRLTMHLDGCPEISVIIHALPEYPLQL